MKFVKSFVLVTGLAFFGCLIFGIALLFYSLKTQIKH